MNIIRQISTIAILVMITSLNIQIHAATNDSSQKAEQKPHEKILEQNTSNEITNWELARPEYQEYLPHKTEITYPENWMHSENNKDTTLPASSNSHHNTK